MILALVTEIKTVLAALLKDDNVNTIKPKYRALGSLKKYNIFKLQ
jgi:hypothetical protein